MTNFLDFSLSWMLTLPLVSLKATRTERSILLVLNRFLYKYILLLLFFILCYIYMYH